MTRWLWIFALLALVLACAVGCGGAQAEAEAASSNPDPLNDVSGQELYRRGRLLAAGGDLIRAEQYYAAAMRRGFPEDEAMPALMQVCVEASRLVAALAYAEPYLARHPDQWSLRMLVASIHMGLDHFERARDELVQVIETAPEEPAQAHYFLGVLYRDALPNDDEAVEHFRRYLALAPEGEHRDEAAAGVTEVVVIREIPEGTPLPQRVETNGDGSTSPPETSAPETSTPSEGESD